MTIDEQITKSSREALGYLELARLTEEIGGDPAPMRAKALESLSIFDDDNLMDLIEDEERSWRCDVCGGDYYCCECV